ncbi:MAG: DUF4011 domain-containing protein [Gammaproteobacteria bacterium]|nr:DUF4011 domain-containing protein [Gammaproteobacteria bacterium]MBT5370527.1 DUF4011 domain-containing protein [Gammaproteobacteria bacterium]
MTTNKSDISSGDCRTVVERLKKRLLDLTNRNRLINYTHTKTSSLRVIDELPDQLIETMMGDKKNSMSFRAVPEPTEEELINFGYLELVDEETGEVKNIKDVPSAEQWAKECYSLNTSYQMPVPSDVSGTDEKHTDTNIQTLLYPHEMEARLRSLYTKAKSSIEESGLNVLYLIFGFVEWYESLDSDKKRRAPLFMIPVTLEKGKLDSQSRTYRYTVKYSGEEIIANHSLMIKMKNDFGIAIPEQSGESLPEAYFEVVQNVIKTKNRWKIQRYITLGLLSFRKQVLVSDLTPDVCRSPIIGEMLSGEGADDNKDGSFDDEFNVDEIEQIHEKYPLIYDADSSQHSVIIDALSGKSLVVEGPPGTGKSQTITNLIAGAIADGKRVLFVAEKLAALEVVKHRMDEAGLGDFCLELHSHKAKRGDVYGALKKRLDKRKKYKSPKALDAEITGYETLKRQLISHVENISKKWGNTDLTIGEILNSATRYRLLLEDRHLQTDKIKEHYDGDSFSPLERRQLKEKISDIIDVENIVVEKLSFNLELKDHPWFGVQNESLIPYDAQEVVELLAAWNQSLQPINEELDNLFNVLGIEKDSPLSVQQSHDLLKQLSSLPLPKAGTTLEILEQMVGEVLKRASEHLDQFHQIEERGGQLAGKLHSDGALKDKETTAWFVAEVRALSALLNNEVTLNGAENPIQLIESINTDLTARSGVLNELLSVFGKQFSGRLDELQLVNNILQVAGALDQKLWGSRDELFDNDDIDLVLPEIKERLEKHSEEIAKTEEQFEIERLLEESDIEGINEVIEEAGLFRWFSSDWRKTKKTLLSLGKARKPDFKKLKAGLSNAIEVANEIKEINGNVQYQEVLGEHLNGHQTDIAHIEVMRDWYRQVRTQFGSGFGPMVQIGSQILGFDKTTLRAIAEQEKQGLRFGIERITDAWKQCKGFLSEQSLDRVDAPFADNAQGLMKISEDIKQHAQAVSEVFVDKSEPLSVILKSATDLERYWQMVEKWATNSGAHAVLSPLSLEIGMSQTDQSRVMIESLIELAQYIQEKVVSPQIKQAVLSNLSDEWAERLKTPVRSLEDALDREKSAFDVFSEKVELNQLRWVKGQDKIDYLIIRNDLALNRADNLGSWISYIQSRSELVGKGFEQIINLLETGEIGLNQLEAGCLSAVYTGLAEEIFEGCREIAIFAGTRQTSAQKRFVEYDKEILRLQREKVAWRADQNHVPRGRTGAKVSQNSDLYLVEHQCNLTRPSASVRRLMAQAGDAVAALMPCLMLSPMSAANYIKHGQETFDILIMDEASQIRPEDAFGVISKVKQVVIVGDQKQLPPTNFFNTSFDGGDDEGDDLIVDGPESILEMASTRFASRRLRWHYRSQHESLIAFSNSRFYNDDLVIFPSPHNESKNFGIQFERIHNGVFQNHRNLEEVNVIVEAVKNHIIHASYESLGIVAMNTHQMDAIERGIESAIKNDKEFEMAHQIFTKKTEEIFIKNLETVQGDERDVIFISMTYGPPKPRVMPYQRFGPINKELGWRRLNVLFTRSRKRMHVFSSMGSDSIKLGPNTKRGVRELHNFFKFCETGELAVEEGETGRPPDSDFEIAVTNELEKHGYECKAQIGVSGFFIDLAVVDPYMPSRYLMGVECDGATYHSAKSARDRDRLRQEILERLGWRIRRIWSTDWFMNPQSEIRPILDELEKLKAASKQEVGEIPEEELQPETEIIDEIIEQADGSEQMLDEYVDNSSLYDQLDRFNREVILVQLPDTPRSKRLLRSAMIEALVEHCPIDKHEFLELIPGYLRDSIEAKEGEYLTDVFKIINASFEEGEGAFEVSL